MSCPPVYVGLPCHLSGVGYSAAALPAPLGLAPIEVQLQTGHGRFFPDVSAGQFFFAEVTDKCNECCETVRVIGKTDDTLTILRDSAKCECTSSNARIRYVSDTRDAILAIASEAPLNVAEPLVWDCATRTLSIDCAKLHEMINNPCV